MTIRAVIFDCDGVLFRSGEANVGFYNEVLRRLGEPDLDPTGSAAAQTFSSSQLFETLFANRPEVAARARAVAQETDYAPFYELMTPSEALYEVLASLRRDRRVAMATNRGKTTTGVVERFGLSPYLEFAVGVLDVERPKPYPDMLQLCVQRFGISPTEAVYVGDQPIDAQAARSAGLHFVAMGREVVDAEHSIARLSDLRGLLDTL
jgi:phosphoglycolate phosphatase